MARSQLAFLNPQLLRWSRETAGYSIEKAAELIGIDSAKLAAAESGRVKLTLRQAEEAARRYQRPLATFYLPDPPPEPPAEAAFRRLPDSPPPPWPAEVRLLARRIRQRQNDALELHELLDEVPAWTRIPPQPSEQAVESADRMRKALGVGLAEQQAWRDRDGYLPLRSWINAVERIGVLVIQDGTVPLGVLRGVASLDDAVPAVVLNAADDPRARGFTLMHELGHHVRQLLGKAPSPADESWCNRFAAQVLMPSQSFQQAFAREYAPDDLLRTMDRLALLYGVTPDAAAVRCSALGTLTDKATQVVRDEIAERGKAASGQGAPGGGDYYRTTVSRLSPRFTQLVFAALDNQSLTYPDASTLLGVKVNNFGRLRDEAMKRLATG